MRRLITKTGLAIAALLVCGAMTFPPTAFASGSPQPFKIKGTMYMTPVDPVASPGLFTFTDVGESTYMGRYFNEGWLQMNVDGSAAAGEGVCYAANGDYNKWKMKPNSFTVIALGGTGRFEGVQGWFDSTLKSMVANPDGTLTMTYVGEGVFVFPNKNKEAALVVAAANTPDGKTIPYRINGTLYLTARDLVASPGLYDFVDTGTATHQGRYWNEGWLQFNADLTIAAGAGTCWMANGDPSNWVAEPNTGRIIILGADEGLFDGVTGYFDSTITSMTMLDADGKKIISTYTGVGELNKPGKDVVD